ncbi:hypothetical protein ABE485_12170 [Achromobacter spanius]|uniref:hypothetical protein n=1 Tax=Achromobacter spanius TaxID=217203 RepID=UPI0032087878
MRSHARTIAIAAALGIVGYFTAIGLMTVLFAPQMDSLAPKTSADAAGWVQAIGSIIAILASYHLGSRQAAQAQRQEAERQAARLAKQQSFGALVLTSTDQILNALELMMGAKADPRVVHMFPATRTIADKVLTSLQAIPMTEVEPPANMLHITGIISSLQHLKQAMDLFDSLCEQARADSALEPDDVERQIRDCCWSFAHKVTVTAANIHDHLQALGVPSSRPHPIYGTAEVPQADVSKGT